MRQPKILSVVIACFLLTAIFSGCSGSKSVGVVRTVFSERLIAEISSPYTGSPLIYSSDARRVAYVADRDGKKYAVIDGVAGKGYSSITNNFYMFSPDGKRTAYIAIVYGEKPPVGNKWFVVIDEEEVKEYDHWPVGPVFSPDSKHVAYVADGVYIDRVQVKSPGGTVQGNNGLIFSPDSQHLVYVIELNGKQSIVLDGIQGRQYDKISRIVFSPDSKHLAYRAKSGNNWFIVLDGKEERQYEAGETDFNPIVFSPDSNHLAYVVHEKYGNPAHKYFVVSDGVEGKRYQFMSEYSLAYSLDSNHLAYTASDDKNTYVIVDGEEKEKPAYSVSDITFSPDSKRLAYVQSKFGIWGNITVGWVVVDGKSYKKYGSVSNIVFSPDSKHVAYLVGKGEKTFVIVDETMGNKYDFLGRGFGVGLSPTSDIKRIIFDSTDSFHYLAQKGNSIYLVEETFK